MKTLKTSLAAAACALACASMAHATVIVHITGSSAYRGAVHQAIQNILTSGSYNYSGTKGLGKANASTFEGTISGTDTVIKCSWSGSVGGVYTVAQHVQAQYLPDGITLNGAGGLSDPTASGATGTDPEYPDIALSDAFQASTPYSTPVLNDTVVGVVPFVFVVSKSGTSKITNITPQLAQATWKNGICSLQQFTGNTADAGTIVYATGRDNDSGTRVGAFAETGVGVNTVVAQYDMQYASPTLYAAEDLYGGAIHLVEGNGGESSGGNLATKMLTDNGNIYVTYLSTGDAQTCCTNSGFNCSVLTYNGVSYGDITSSATQPNVANGNYTYWGYEHFLYNTGTIAANVKVVGDKISKEIHDTTATVKLTTMNVNRLLDGGTITYGAGSY